MDSQDQHISLTNLLSGNYHMSLDDSPPLPPNNGTNLKKSMRGSNFSTEEDKLIVSAWLNCSIDAVQGKDQKRSTFWEQIFEYFHQHKESTNERTIKSLSHRWSCIQKATNSFCGYLSQVEGINQSGITEHDRLEKAKIMYESLEKSTFQFEHCWYILKEQAKWISRPKKDVLKQNKVIVSTPNLSPATTPSPTKNVTENEVIELDQPMGRKAEKQKRKAVAKQNEENIQFRKMKYAHLEESRAQEKEIYRLKAEKMEFDRKTEEERLRLQAEKTEYDRKAEEERLRLQAEKLRIEAEKTELAKKESDERIMMMDVNTMAELQRLYFEERQREIIMRSSRA